MTKITKKRKTCYCKWQIDTVVDELDSLRKEVKYLKELVINNTLTIYSAGQDTAIGRTGKWHQIVCNYNGNICLGGVRPHWVTYWDIKEDGFHLREMRNENWKGWHGQYNERNELKYDELPKDVLLIHHNVLKEHILKMAIYYPCHFYNDFTGELCRP